MKWATLQWGCGSPDSDEKAGAQAAREEGVVTQPWIEKDPPPLLANLAQYLQP